MENKVNVQQLKEVLDFVGYVAEKSVLALKDGVQVTDLAIVADLELFNKAKLALDGINQLGAEAKDLDLIEAKELIVMAIDIVAKVVVAAKKA